MGEERKTFFESLNNAKCDFNFAIDLKFFNDQLKNYVVAGVAAGLGGTLIATSEADLLSRIGGVGILLYGILMLFLNMFQLIAALFKMWSPKRQCGPVKGTISVFVLVALLIPSFYGMTEIWMSTLLKELATNKQLITTRINSKECSGVPASER